MSCEVSYDDGNGGEFSYPIDGNSFMHEGNVYWIWGDCSTSWIVDDSVRGPDACTLYPELTCGYVSDGMNEPPWSTATANPLDDVLPAIGAFQVYVIGFAVLMLVAAIAFRMLRRYATRAGGAA